MRTLQELPKVILASGSPRRKDLLNQIHIEPIIMPSDIEENMSFDGNTNALVMALSFEKAFDVYKKCQKDKVENGIILAADTVVVYEHQILGKPQNFNEAKKMLTTLSAKKHQVYTGVAFIDLSSGKKYVDYEKTDVCFNSIDEALIDAYLSLDKPLDKAGAYGIQDMGALFVKCIEGDYFNVMGLPLSKVYHILKNIFKYDCFLEHMKGRGSINHEKGHQDVT